MSKSLKMGFIACSCLALLALGSSANARILQPGESIPSGGVIHSEDGRYVGTLQADGNFVVYSNTGPWRAIWSTNTTGRGAIIATMQHDGKFVMYDAAGRAIWWTSSRGRDRTFTITEYGQAMVMAPGRVDPHTPGPGTVLWKRLRVKPVWTARDYDRVPGTHGNGPRCVGNPHDCPRQLLTVPH